MGHLYSLTTTHQLTCTCKHNRTINSEIFVLLPVSDEVKLTTDTIRVPDLPKILADKEESELTENSKHAQETLRKLDEIIKQVTPTLNQRYVPLSHLLRAMQDDHQQIANWQLSLLGAILTIGSLVFLGICWKEYSTPY
jgi:hypothetical protein